MRVLVRMAGAAILVAMAAPAPACMAEPLPDAVLFDSRPARPPAGYSVIEVVGPVSPEHAERIRVTVVDPERRRRIGATAWLVPEQMSSCTDWGRLGSRAFAVVRPAGRLQGIRVLHAKIYRRSRWDHFWSFFGITRYTAARTLGAPSISSAPPAAP
ncbi:MAG TPA: hypothetical protein VEA60_12235 [Allosphingosinicella sp.]|nr:hypothetical protein [Allosphingosinicella sp.]